MKPESIKSILKSYLKERQLSSSYNEIPDYFNEPPEYMPDFPAISYAPSEYISGEPFHCVADGPVVQGQQGVFPFEEWNVLKAEAAVLPLEELNEPLEPQLVELAVGVGRRLSQISEEFELNLMDSLNYQTSANENRGIEFQKRFIRVPITCDCVQIPVIRTAAIGGVVNTTWRTCDKSAKAGLHYFSNQGNISFAQGDEKKIIEVKIIRDQEKKTDLCFAVELFDAEGIFNTVTVYIVDDSKLYPEEEQFIKNIFSSARPISISEIITCLSDAVTHNTFKAALQCLCSSADTIPKELALASELLRLTMPQAPLSTLTNVFCEYFSYLPELEDIASMF